MKRAILLVLTIVLSSTQTAGAAESESATAQSEGGVALSHLLERAAVRLNKRFIVDPRVRGNALLVGIDPERITYRELQAVLAVHGFMTTQEANGTIAIVPDANARQMPMPVLGERGGNAGDDEFVTQVFDVAPLQATQLVPILRPLLPQYAHMVGYQATNTLVVVARAANVKQIEAILRELRKRPVNAVPEPAQPKP